MKSARNFQPWQSGQEESWGAPPPSDIRPRVPTCYTWFQCTRGVQLGYAPEGPRSGRKNPNFGVSWDPCLLTQQSNSNRTRLDNSK